jgi:Holliday junction resolvase
MPVNSRQKGARYERELAAAFKDEGFKQARRGQQYCGANGDADVVGLPGIHVEAKRVEHLNLYDAMAQAVRNAKKKEEIPAVFHRKNHCETLVTMRMDDWFKIYHEWEAGNEVD